MDKIVKKIAVLCALPPDRNTGMATVDLAAMSVLRRLAPQAEIMLYAFGMPRWCTYQRGDLPYEYLNVEEHKEDYLRSDIFIFWGDFIHSHSYWQKDQVLVDPAAVTLSGQALQQWLQERFTRYSQYIFLTSLAPERLKNVIVFGSTLIADEAQDQLDHSYYEYFTRFFEGIGAAYFRDALSAAKISPLRKAEASLGCDAAFLLEDADLSQLAGFTPASRRKGVGVFFGRSPAKLRQMLFARMIGKYVGEKCSWLAWFPWHSHLRRHRWPYMLLGYKIRSGNATPGFLLSALSGYSYIVTDTYHLCVNAWRMGIPAICIGDGAKVGDHSLSDKKKEILYEMYGARQFYVFRESLRSLRVGCREATRAADVLRNAALVSQVSANIRQHQEMALRRLSDALNKLLIS